VRKKGRKKAARHIARPASRPWAAGSRPRRYHRDRPGSWTAALTTGSIIAHTLTSYAYCAAGLKVVETSSDAALPAFGPVTAITTATAPPCPAGKSMLGGGFSNPPATVSSGIALLTNFSSLIGGAWRVSAFNFNVVAGTLDSRGYCA
jgi:hypothetical protein